MLNEPFIVLEANFIGEYVCLYNPSTFPEALFHITEPMIQVRTPFANNKINIFNFNFKFIMFTGFFINVLREKNCYLNGP